MGCRCSCLPVVPACTGYSLLLGDKEAYGGAYLRPGERSGRSTLPRFQQLNHQVPVPNPASISPIIAQSMLKQNKAGPSETAAPSSLQTGGGSVPGVLTAAAPCPASSRRRLRARRPHCDGAPGNGHASNILTCTHLICPLASRIYRRVARVAWTSWPPCL